MQDQILQALRRNAVDDAVQLAREWTTAEPEQPQAHRWLSLSLQQQGQFDDALASLQQALTLARQASKAAALEAMTAFAVTDFRDDLAKVSVPTLVIHGDSDGTVPFEGSGARTHAAIAGSELVLIEGGPHGVNVSHAEEWNRAVLEFLAK